MTMEPVDCVLRVDGVGWVHLTGVQIGGMILAGDMQVLDLDSLGGVRPLTAEPPNAIQTLFGIPVYYSELPIACPYLWNHPEHANLAEELPDG